MGELIVQSSCSSHLEKEAVASCDVCGRPVCSGCRIADMLLEADFCSLQCQEIFQDRRSRRKDEVGTDLSSGLRSPIRTGWALWFRNIPRLMAYLIPIAVMLALVAAADMARLDIQLRDLGSLAEGEQLQQIAAQAPEPSLLSALAILFLSSYGLALSETILSQQYLLKSTKTPYWQTLKRYLLWFVTIVLLMVAVAIGLLLLIVPGILLGVRLFWAPELALCNGHWPLSALRESWEVTRGRTTEVLFFQILLGLAEFLLYIPFLAILVIVGYLVVPLLPTLPLIMGFMVGVFFLLTFLFYGSCQGPSLAYLYGLRNNPF